jgi:hypothetical protein
MELETLQAAEVIERIAFERGRQQALAGYETLPDIHDLWGPFERDGDFVYLAAKEAVSRGYEYGVRLRDEDD